MLEIIDGIIWLFVIILLLSLPFNLIAISWGDSVFWLKMLGTNFALFIAFLMVGKVTDRLITMGGFNK